jgi:hypothetical protein
LIKNGSEAADCYQQHFVRGVSLRQVCARISTASGSERGYIKSSLNVAALATARGADFMAPSLQKRGIDPDNRFKPEQDDRWRDT